MDKIREKALLCIYDIEYNGAYSNMAVKAAAENLQHKDSAFLAMLVYGVIKSKITLDYIIQKYSKIKIKKISKYILQILRMGIYQIYFADKIPASAATDECVKLAKRYGHKASAGFVNGLLRAAARNTDVEYPKENRAEYLSVKYSYPLDMAERWIENFGFEYAEKIMINQSGQPDMFLRVNRLKSNCDEIIKYLKEKNISAEKIWLDFFVKSGGFNIAVSEIYQNGSVTAQNMASALAVTVLDPKENENILDICAAPGGKTTLCGELMNNRGNITACDIHKHKVDIIKKNVRRMGIDTVNAVVSDALVYRKDFENRFDRVLADVPCSGTGIIKRKPDIKYKEQTDYDMQMRILENASGYVKPGGVLVYSTCSIEKRENEDVIKLFLKNNKNFEIEDIDGYLPEGIKSGNKGYITLYPGKDGTDGFFMCRMRKK